MWENIGNIQKIYTLISSLLLHRDWMDGLSSEVESSAKSAKPSGSGAFSFLHPSEHLLPINTFHLSTFLHSLHQLLPIVKYCFSSFSIKVQTGVFNFPEKNANQKENVKRDGNLIQNFQKMLLRKKFELDNVAILHFQHTYFYEIWDEIIFTTLTHMQRNPWYYVKFWQLFRVLLQLHSTNNQWRLFRWDLKDVNCVKLSLFQIALAFAFAVGITPSTAKFSLNILNNFVQTILCL